MKNIIRQILKEDRRQMFLDKIVHVIKNDYPLLKNMELYGFYDQLSEEELIYIFSEIFGQPVTINKMTLVFNIYDDNRKKIYFEYSDGKWRKYEYDENGYEYFLRYDGLLEKYQHDDKGNIIYYERPDGYWQIYEYDENGNMIYSENWDGDWEKWEYDENGKLIYYEDSTGYREYN